MVQVQPTPGMPRGIDAVRLAQTAADRERVFRLRYDVHVVELGKTPTGADNETRLLTDEHDDVSDLHIVEADGEILGTVQRTFSSDGREFGRAADSLLLRYFPLQSDELMSMSRRFVVRPDRRRTWVATALAISAYDRARTRNVVYDFLTSAPGLVPLYERLGYQRFTEGGFVATDVGLLIPMVLMVTDHAHLDAISSPFMHAGRNYADDPSRRGWLTSTFAAAAQYYPRMGEDAAPGRRATIQEDLDAINRVLGPERGDARRLVAQLGYVHRFPAGSTLYRPGDPCSCAYVMLDGEMRSAECDGAPLQFITVAAPDLDSLTPPPTSRVWLRCTRPSRLLCLPLESLQVLGRREPTIYAKLRALRASHVQTCA